MTETAKVSELLTQLAVAVQRPGNEERHRGQLLGQVSADYLLLTAAPEAGLQKDERIVVRTLQAGRALGFETVVREVLDEPVRLYFLAVPGQVEVLRLRKTDRMDLFVPADVRFATGTDANADTLMLKGNIVDVSGGGCRMVTKRPIPAGTVVNVSFMLPGERHTCALSGSVLDGVSQGTRHTHRVKFFASERHVEDLAHIKRWVQQHADFADKS